MTKGIVIVPTRPPSTGISIIVDDDDFVRWRRPSLLLLLLPLPRRRLSSRWSSPPQPEGVIAPDVDPATRGQIPSQSIGRLVDVVFVVIVAIGPRLLAADGVAEGVLPALAKDGAAAGVGSPPSSPAAGGGEVGILPVFSSGIRAYS